MVEQIKILRKLQEWVDSELKLEGRENDTISKKIEEIIQQIWDPDHALDLVMNDMIEDILEEDPNFMNPNQDKSKMVFLIDIDGTICDDIKNEESHLYPSAKPIIGSRDIINKWYDEGHTVTFFTARESKDRLVTLSWLYENGFKFHGLVMDKPRIKDGEEYCWIDNRKVRAVTYLGTWSELTEVDTKIKVFKE
jgi:hypothetical protein